MRVPEELLYTDRHGWVSVERRAATVGLTDYAQNALRDIVLVELPAVGRTVSKGEEVATIESSKAVAGFFSPVSGTILDVNHAVEDDPGLINADPYKLGWICKLSVSDPTELSELMGAAQYEQFCGKQR